MDTKKYEALMTSIQCGSFTKAASKLGYTQSGLTHMMAKLENEVGFKLFKRGHYGIRLTQNGQELLPDIQRLLDSKNVLQASIDRIHKNSLNRISIGCCTGISTHWLPVILRKFRYRFPDTELDIRVGGPEELYTWLQNGEITLLYASYVPNEHMTWIPLRNDPLLAVVPRYKTYAGLSEFSVSSFSGRNFLMPSSLVDKEVTEIFRKGSAHPNIRPTRLDDSAVIAMVENGLGLSILSELIMRGRRDNVLSVPLDSGTSRSLGIAMQADSLLTDAAKYFIECSKAAVEELYND